MNINDPSYHEAKPLDPRYCRTHAMVAQLFADCPRHSSNADAWSYVAKAWADLAALKENIERDHAARTPDRR
jgi:hypothetical protein